MFGTEQYAPFSCSVSVYKSPVTICPLIHFAMQVTSWFMENADPFLEKNQLGSTLSESEELLQEHKEFELKAKVGPF